MGKRHRAGRDLAKEQFWRTVVQGFNPQRTTVRQWCADQGVSEPSFYGWRRELKRRDRAGRPTARPKQGVRLLAVKIAPPVPMPQRAQKLIVRLKSGVRLLVSVDQLPAVLDVLERRPC